MTYVVSAEISLKPEHFEEAVAAVRGILAETRNEPGCEQFVLHRASDDSPRLFIYERWRDRASFDFHHAQSYTRSVYRSYETWLADTVSITELTDVE